MERCMHLPLELNYHLQNWQFQRERRMRKREWDGSFDPTFPCYFCPQIPPHWLTALQCWPKNVVEGCVSRICNHAIYDHFFLAITPLLITRSIAQTWLTMKRRERNPVVKSLNSLGGLHVTLQRCQTVTRDRGRSEGFKSWGGGWQRVDVLLSKSI